MDLRKDRELVLEVRGLTKSFPGVQALDQVSISLCAGEVLGVIGENGAGKSTLMKVISGAVAPDSGSVLVNGLELALGDPRRSLLAGISMIYQELTVVPEMTILANVFLGRFAQSNAVGQRARAYEEFSKLAETVGFKGKPGNTVGLLSTADQQLIEVMRALASEKRIIIMDEPTASLGPEDIERLHQVIQSLRSKGYAILYVSHDLDAVMEISDRVTVMREGSVVETRPVADWDKPALIRGMLGGADLANVALSSIPPKTGSPLFTATDLSGPGVSLEELTVYPGEIIGIAGLVGSGRTRLLRSLAGANPLRTGTLTRNGITSPWPRNVRSAIRQGFGLAPEDRKAQGLVLGREAGWNVAVGKFAGAAGKIVTNSHLAGAVKDVVVSLGFNPAKLRVPAGTLSGGNQQKLLLSRWLFREIPVVLLDEPTRGIDIAAKAQIFETLRNLVREGKAVIWASSELEEVVQHSDRILVVGRGQLLAELPGGSTVRDVLNLSFSTSGDSGRNK